MNTVARWTLRSKQFRPSLRTAVAVPFVLVICITVLLLSLSHYREIKKITYIESSYLLDAVAQATTSELQSFLGEPFLIQQNLAKEIANLALHTPGDMRPIYQYILRTLQELQTQRQQISVLAFGNERGETTGLRRQGNTQDFSLILKDNSTAQKLVIFEGSSPDSAVQTRYENYDPRTRAWYTIAAQVNDSGWTRIEGSADGHNDITIAPSTLVRYNKQVIGVVTSDIRLSSLGNFLQQQSLRRSGSIFITEADGRLIAQSENTPLVGATPENERLFMSQSASPLIRAAAKWVNSAPVDEAKDFRLELNDTLYFGRVTPFREAHGLQWKIVTLIPESDLLGNVLASSRNTLIAVLFIAALGTMFGLWVIERMTVSISRTVKAASRLAQGDLEARITTKSRIAETHALISVFNQMSHTLQHTVHQLQDEVDWSDLGYLLTRPVFLERLAHLPSERAVLCAISLHVTPSAAPGEEPPLANLLLQSIARRLREKLPRQALAARLETDMLAIVFTPLAPDDNDQDYATLAQALFTAPFAVGARNVTVLARVGYTSGMLHQKSIAHWLEDADHALARALKNQTKIPQKFGY